jgi:hypothetical protein
MVIDHAGRWGIRCLVSYDSARKVIYNQFDENRGNNYQTGPFIETQTQRSKKEFIL